MKPPGAIGQRRHGGSSGAMDDEQALTSSLSATTINMG